MKRKDDASLLDVLLPRIRQEILSTLLLDPERRWYASALARHLGVRPSSLQRELSSLTAAGVLSRQPEGKQVYYRAATECPILPELQGLLLKTAGLVDAIRNALAPLRRRIELAFVHGSFARGDALSTSDVDLLVVGRVGLVDLTPQLRIVEDRLGRPINASVYTAAEFRRRVEEKHHFVMAVLSSKMLFVEGSRDELDETLARRPNRAAAGKEG